MIPLGYRNLSKITSQARRENRIAHGYPKKSYEAPIQHINEVLTDLKGYCQLQQGEPSDNCWRAYQYLAAQSNKVEGECKETWDKQPQLAQQDLDHLNKFVNEGMARGRKALVYQVNLLEKMHNKTFRLPHGEKVKTSDHKVGGMDHFEMEQLKRVFASCDKNKDGVLNQVEFEEAMKELGYELSEHQEELIGTALDIHGSISWDAFCAALETILWTSPDHGNEVLRIFGRGGSNDEVALAYFNSHQ